MLIFNLSLLNFCFYIFLFLERYKMYDYFNVDYFSNLVEEKIFFILKYFLLCFF